jgi:hypothetical protein
MHMTGASVCFCHNIVLIDTTFSRCRSCSRLFGARRMLGIGGELIVRLFLMCSTGGHSRSIRLPRVPFNSAASLGGDFHRKNQIIIITLFIIRSSARDHETRQ